MIELSRYAFETLRQDEEFAFCRGRRDDGQLPTILLVAPVSEHPVPAIMPRLVHQYTPPVKLILILTGLSGTSDSLDVRPLLNSWAAGGGPLDRILGSPLEL